MWFDFRPEETVLFTTLAVLIGFLYWLHDRARRRKMELEHAERIKAIEAGVSVPDEAAAKARQAQVVGAAVIGLGVPVIGSLIAAALSLYIFAYQPTNLQIALFAILWGVQGLVSLLCVILAIGSMMGDEEKSPAQEGGMAAEFRSESIYAPVNPIVRRD